MKARLRLWALVSPPIAAIVLLAATGCGDGDSTATVTVSSVTPAQYAKRASAACAQGRLRGIRYQPSDSDKMTNAGLAAAIEANLLPALQEVIDQLYAMGAPAGKKPQIEAFLTAFQQALDEAEGLEAPSFERLEPVFKKEAELAQQLGLEPCVYG